MGLMSQPSPTVADGRVASYLSGASVACLAARTPVGNSIMGKKDKDKSKKSSKKNKNMAESDIIETEGTVVETKSAKTLSEQQPRGMRKYIDRALGVLDKLGISRRDDVPQELVRLLDDVRDLDEPKVVAIANTIRYMSTFNALVRDNVENINVGNRYLAITEMFDSVREDSKMLINQLQDGRISFGEKMSNLWMRMRRGTPSDRFDKIVDVYQEVSKDTKDQLDREQNIMDGYIDFRFALKEAEVASPANCSKAAVPNWTRPRRNWPTLRRRSTSLRRRRRDRARRDWN